MQLQLIELRTTNYELEGKCKKFDREFFELQEKNEALDRELAKANKAISKSKKAKETELLLQENDSLQRKLLSQEDEFRLQNQTLMTELSMLVASNEQLEKECSELKAAGRGGDMVSATGERSPGADDEVRHLQAQNAALQKNLTAMIEKYERKLSSLRDETERLRGRESPAGSEDVGEEKREVEGQADDEAQASATAAVSSTLNPQRRIEDLLERLKELQLSLDTAQEEKQLQKDQLANQEKKMKEQMASLQEEVEKAGERLKKKQESLLQVQKEKDALFEDSKKKAEELQAARDRDQKYYQDQISKLQQEIEKTRQSQESVKSASEGHVHGLQRRVDELQKQVNAASIVGNHQLQEQSAKYQQEIKDLTTQLVALRQKNEDLGLQLQESHRANEHTVSQLSAAQQERDSQIQALQEANKVAEKRKALLDELAIKYQKEYDAHREQVKVMEEKHAVEVQVLQEDIRKLEARVQELSKTQPLLEELNGKLRSLEDAKGWLERRLKETEDQLEQSRKELEETTNELKTQHETEVRAVSNKHSEELQQKREEGDKRAKEWEEKEAKLMEEVNSLKNKVSTLQQSIKDGVCERKIQEKKGMTMLKDLKRQLHAERKRAEKLQERLQEVLTDTKNKSMEELFQPADPRDLNLDSSSVSSWSTGASGLGKDSSASGPQSPTTNNNSFGSLSPDSGDEYAELLHRLAEVQEEKWSLEEKVNHLETSNACMAEDLLQKTAIIEHYVMNTHLGGRRQTQNADDSKLTLKKVMELVKSGDHSELHEMNKKLQLMLEETLTKNMHLQQDLEMMSQEVVRLSKLFVQNPSTPANGSAQEKRHSPPSEKPASNSTDCISVTDKVTADVANKNSSDKISTEVTNQVTADVSEGNSTPVPKEDSSIHVVDRTELANTDGTLSDGNNEVSRESDATDGSAAENTTFGGTSRPHSEGINGAQS